MENGHRVEGCVANDTVNGGSELGERADLCRVFSPLPLMENTHHIHTCARKPSRLLLLSLSQLLPASMIYPQVVHHSS